MGLSQLGLGTITQVASASTATVLTVGAGKTAYVKSLMLHNLDQTNVSNVVVHFVHSPDGSVGTANATNEIARIGIATHDTFMLEMSYPLTLGNTNDTIQVYNINSAGIVNVQVLGDREI